VSAYGPKGYSIEGTAILLAASTETGQPSVTTASLAAGAVAGVVDIQALRNPLQVPMLVDEILFNIGLAGGGSALGYEEDIRLTLKLGNDKIVKEYTPLILLGPQKNLSVNPTSGALTNPPTGATALAAQLNAPLFSMRLTSELILMPQEFLVPNFYHAGQLGQASVAVRMIVKGRAMKADAKRQTLPWIAPWIGALQAPAGNIFANLLEETTEADLHNPFDVPLYVDRMAGVVASTSGSGFGQYFDPYTVDAGLYYALMRMVDQNGAPILRDFTPFSHIFHMSDYTWKMKSTMAPNSFWKAYFQENYSLMCNSGGPTAPSLQLMCSIIGKRQVRS
jgi:hypothetical protein